MAYPTNILQQVQTYQHSELAFLQNLCCFVSTANTRFKNFQDFTANLGSSVTYDKPYRFNSSNGLIATFQSIEQRVSTLTCDQARNTSYTVTDPQRIFNFSDKEYMQMIGKAAMAELATAVESNLALNAISAVPVNNIVNNQYQPTGALHVDSGPYRFYGNGVTAINSYTQLATMIEQFKAYGAVSQGIKVYLPNTIIPSIVGSGLNQFAPNRNNDIAMSWEVGSFGTPPVQYYESNLLPIHIAGTVGDNTTPGANVLTVVSTNDPTGAKITQITFSGAGTSDANAIKSGDLMQFNDGVSNRPNMRYLTFIGHFNNGAVPVQIKAQADAGSTAGAQVTVNITPALSVTPGKNQNINNNIVAGMQVTVMPSHKAGLVVGGDAFYVAMPRLPDQNPFATANEYDKDTGVALRMYYGSIFGQAEQGIVHDVTWGSNLEPEYSMRILIPLTQ